MQRPFLFLFLVLPLQLLAAGELMVSGGRQAAMGWCSVSAADLWSVSNNPAGCAFTRGLSAGIYAENRFLVPGLTNGAAAVSYSSKPGAFMVCASRFGNSLYNEIRILGGYARKFGPRFAAGVTLDYLRVQQGADYGNLDALSCSIGLMYKPDAKWALGLHLVNPIPVSLLQNRSEKLPVTFRTGVLRLFGGIVEVAAECEKTLGLPAVIRTGLEYRVHRTCSLRAGYQSNPQTVTAGVGLRFGGIRISLAAGWQTALGISPAGGIEYGSSE